MSVLTRKRLLVMLFASIAVSTTLLANPAPRISPRMAHDPASGNIVLFGGISDVDHATGLAYSIGETWIFGGTRWLQQFPATSPQARDAHAMVTDTARGRLLLFGGKNITTDLNDLWTWRDGNWVEIPTPNAPSPRHLPAMTYDRVRDRVIVFGGAHYSADKKSIVEDYDTWEFDGTRWEQRATTGPNVGRPLIAYDAWRNQTILVGLNQKSETEMYSYNPADATWTKVTPEKLPLCVNQGSMVYSDALGRIVLVGGLCSIITDVAFTWDGTAWSALETENKIDQIYGQAMAFDRQRSMLVMFGGIPTFDNPLATTYILSGNKWVTSVDTARPTPRSLAAFVSDPVTKSIWLFGGLDQHENGYLNELWRYRDGQWHRQVAENAPTNCGMPLGVFDSGRNKVVINCGGDTMYEWDVVSLTWTSSFPNVKDKPTSRRYAQMAYDPNLKKTVLFGGLETYSYSDQTWLWDGNVWSQVKKNRADARALGAMWFDRSLGKVVLYGGLGAPDPEDAVRRYSDMWSFDTEKGWTQIKNVVTPGERYGALVTVDPVTGQTLLFGGLRVDEKDKVRRQVFGDDLWRWDGSTWTKLTPSNVPPERENGMFGFDHTANRYVMYGGYAGYFRSDVWTSSDLMTWNPVSDSFKTRRRAVGR